MEENEETLMRRNDNKGTGSMKGKMVIVGVFRFLKFAAIHQKRIQHVEKESIRIDHMDAFNSINSITVNTCC